MDPASIVGVAAAGLQFLSFTAKVASGSWRAVGVARNLPIQAAELVDASKNFNATVIHMCAILESIDTAEKGELSDIERMIYNVCADSREKAKELHDATAAVAQKLNDESPIRSLWEALRQELGAGRLEKLTADMDRYQQQLLNVTVSSLWEDSKQNTQSLVEMRKQMTALQSTITQLTQYEVASNLRVGPRHDTSSDRAVDSLIFANANLGQIDWARDSMPKIQAEIMEVISEDDNMRFEPLDEAEAGSPLYKRAVKDIVQSLTFDAMGQRQNNIQAPLDSTLEWIWQRQTGHLPGTPRDSRWSSFPDWLEEDSSRPYWITGKPGSGKSTLMRHIENHHKLRHHLENWRPGTPLRVLSLYAWNPGMDSEKSIDGLIRTILVQGIRELPALVPVVLPRRWKFSTTMWGAPYPRKWELEDFRNLEDGLYRFLEESRSRIRLMILVDGLDEFDVAPKRLIQTIERISTEVNVKLCVASRPWTEFADRFAKFPTLAMDKLTGNDIQIYTAQRFREVLASRDRPSEVEHLRETIHQQAEGVFQWVVVVVNFLIEKLEQGDSLQTLLSVVDTLPRELASLYSAIWSRISKDLREKAKEIFALQSASLYNQIHFLTLWAVNERHTTNTALLVETAKNPQKINNIVSRILNSRTLGLLEINSKGFVSYLHRTAPEWISEAMILRDCPVQPDYAILHGLCNWGPYLSCDPIDGIPWAQKLLSFISYHTAKIAGDPELAMLNPEEVVKWLDLLEREFQVQPSEYPQCSFFLENRDGAISITSNPPVRSFVDMIAVCGFEPFIKSRLKQDESLARTKVFFFSLYPPYFVSYMNSHMRWTETGQASTTSRLGCVQSCLDHGADPWQWTTSSEQWLQPCSLKDIIRDLRILTELHEREGYMEEARYYFEVEGLVEAWCREAWKRKIIKPARLLTSMWGHIRERGWSGPGNKGSSRSSSAESLRRR